MSEYVEVEVTVTQETPGAIKVIGKSTDWVPKSLLRDQVERVPSEGPVTIEVPEWLAVEKGLV